MLIFWIIGYILVFVGWVAIEKMCDNLTIGKLLFIIFISIFSWGIILIAILFFMDEIIDYIKERDAIRKILDKKL